jgi:hypothetical protein
LVFKSKPLLQRCFLPYYEDVVILYVYTHTHTYTHTYMCASELELWYYLHSKWKYNSLKWYMLNKSPMILLKKCAFHNSVNIKMLIPKKTMFSIFTSKWNLSFFFWGEDWGLTLARLARQALGHRWNFKLLLNVH